MAGPGTATQTVGWGDTWGGRFIQAIDYTGVAAYVNGTGELLDPKMFGCPESLMFVDGGISISGNYYVICQSANKGFTTWHVRWFVVATGVEVTNGTNLSGETVKLWGFGV